MKREREISVVIPTYNRSQMVKRAVQSVLSQTYQSFELLVVDDGSTESLSEVERLVSQTPHRFLRKSHGGVASARNFGAHASRGKWLAFLDSDDVWLPDKLLKQRQFFSERPKCVISQCREIWFRHGRRVNPAKHLMMQSGDIFLKSLQMCAISPSSVMLLKECFEEFNGFDEHLPVCEDYDLWLRITARHSVGIVDEYLVEKFAGHADQLSCSRPAMDRYRVFSMMKLLRNEKLTREQFYHTVDVLEKKAKILAHGAIKREKRAAAKFYLEIADASRQLEYDSRETLSLLPLFDERLLE